jgi:hypothetical protein
MDLGAYAIVGGGSSMQLQSAAMDHGHGPSSISSHAEWRRRTTDGQPFTIISSRQIEKSISILN